MDKLDALHGASVKRVVSDVVDDRNGKFLIHTTDGRVLYVSWVGGAIMQVGVFQAMTLGDD